MVATTADILKQQAAGKYTIRATAGIASIAGTFASSTSGFVNITFGGNTFGTTFPGTIGSVNGASVSSELLITTIVSSASAGRHGGICRLYKIGDVNFTALGNCFTHDAATYPLLRTAMGVSNAPQSFIPILQITGTTGGAAAQFQIRDATSTTGYINQDGTTVIGNKTFVLPSATTIAGSVYFLPLNDGDYACRDITQVTCTVAGTNAFGTIWMLEDLGLGQSGIAAPGITDHVYGSGLRLTQAVACTSTTGTVSTVLIPYYFGSAATSTNAMISLGILP